MEKYTYFLLLGMIIIGIGCTDCEIDTPENYSFLRDGNSSVSYSGQTTRIQMASELTNAMLDFTKTENDLLEMFRNQKPDGSDANPFSSEALNESTKSISSKVAASSDYFSTNTVQSAKIKADFESWINAQVSEIFPNQNTLADENIAGQIADGSTVRYVSAKGLEYNQAVAKGLIGGLMVDQLVNNYLSPAVLDAGENRNNNDEELTEEGKSYTSMEHKWDEAFGYLFGLAEDGSDPLASLGADDFLNKYLKRVEDDDDFTGIAKNIVDAFTEGRTAIVNKEYSKRDKQAEILKDEISKVIGIRAVYYLQQGKLKLESNDRGGAFHDLSEGYGFVYSLQFTRKANSDDAYFTFEEVDAMIDTLEKEKGFWSITSSDLDQLSDDIADRFDFTVEEARD